MMDENWSRWIYASVTKHFLDAVVDQDYILYLDRYDRDVNWAELRFDGPRIKEYTRDCFKIEAIVNIMITSFIGTDTHKIHRMTGLLASACTDICIYRYGDGISDDQTLLGALVREQQDKIDITNYGLILPANRFVRSTVEAYYSMWLP